MSMIPVYIAIFFTLKYSYIIFIFVMSFKRFLIDSYHFVHNFKLKLNGTFVYFLPY